jgi:hypothetical protein
MLNSTVIVSNQSIAQIICAAGIKTPWITVALQNVNVSEARHFFGWIAEP